jgi:hypothetical protein
LGIYYTSYAVIGVRVPEAALGGKITKVSVPSCEHPAREGHAFCPVCGKKVATRVETDCEHNSYERAEAIVEALGEGEWLCAGPNDGFDSVFVGWGGRSSRDDEYEFVPLPDPATVLQRLREVLEPMGFWDAKVEATFGLHAVTMGA